MSPGAEGSNGPFWHWEGDWLHLAILGKPSSRIDALGAVHGGRLKVHVRAPAADGRATAAILLLLASRFDVPPGRVELLSGLASPHKRVRILRPGRLAAGVRGAGS